MARFDPGKEAEAEAKDWLEKRSDSDAHFAFHRYPDARSARNIMAAQPADFEVAYDPFCLNLEVKETANPRRLARTKVRQWPILKKFSLAGKKAYVLVYRSAFKDWVILDDKALFDHADTPTSFSFEGLTPYPSAAAALESIFP